MNEQTCDAGKNNSPTPALHSLEGDNQYVGYLGMYNDNQGYQMTSLHHDIAKNCTQNMAEVLC